MTRKWLIDTIRQYAGNAFTEELADVILAEMAGDWNAACDAIAAEMEARACGDRGAAIARSMRRPTRPVTIPPTFGSAKLRKSGEDAQPAPQADEVANVVEELRTVSTDCPLQNVQKLADRATDLLAAQATEIERLKRERDFAIAGHDGQAWDKDCIAGWLAAKDAEIAAKNKRMAGLNDQIDALLTRIAELETKLLPFAEIIAARDADIARAALAPTEKEPQ